MESSTKILQSLVRRKSNKKVADKNGKKNLLPISYFDFLPKELIVNIFSHLLLDDQFSLAKTSKYLLNSSNDSISLKVFRHYLNLYIEIQALHANSISKKKTFEKLKNYYMVKYPVGLFTSIGSILFTLNNFINNFMHYDTGIIGSLVIIIACLTLPLIINRHCRNLISGIDNEIYDFPASLKSFIHLEYPVTHKEVENILFSFGIAKRNLKLMLLSIRENNKLIEQSYEEYLNCPQKFSFWQDEKKQKYLNVKEKCSFFFVNGKTAQIALYRYLHYKELNPSPKQNSDHQSIIDKNLSITSIMIKPST